MPADALFRMTVKDVFFIRGRGTVVTGQVETGSLHVGDEIYLNGQNGSRQVIVMGIEMFRKILDYAQPGDNVGVLLREVRKEDVQQGDVLMGSGYDFTWKP
jgi:elongation factor Tu